MSVLTSGAANIASKLNSIIKELESIESGIRNDFQGIGNEKCADIISNVISNYRCAVNQLNSIKGSSTSAGGGGSTGGGGAFGRF